MRSFGWRRDSHDARAGITRQRTVKERGSLPNSYELGAGIEPLDQGSSQACVAFALALAIQIGGPGLPLPSMRWIYQMARDTHGEGDRDDGTYISAAVRAIRDLGWPVEGQWPWDEHSAIGEPPVSVRRVAFDHCRTMQMLAPIGGGGSFRGAIKTAISQGHPVVFGMPVTEGFCDLSHGGPIPMVGRIAGNHAMVATGYDADTVTVLNSWGSSWGDHGRAKITWEDFEIGSREVYAVQMEVTK